MNFVSESMACKVLDKGHVFSALSRSRALITSSWCSMSISPPGNASIKALASAIRAFSSFVCSSECLSALVSLGVQPEGWTNQLTAFAIAILCCASSVSPASCTALRTLISAGWSDSKAEIGKEV